MECSGGRYVPTLQKTLKLGKFSSSLFHHSNSHSFPHLISPLPSSPDLPGLFFTLGPCRILRPCILFLFLPVLSSPWPSSFLPCLPIGQESLCTLLLYCVLIRQFAANFASSGVSQFASHSYSLSPIVQLPPLHIV
ncbi:hypothetical protein BDW72DRAFT_124235 [Aspergillus terricola var. indicus]